jgi:hypothetical protein
MSYVEFKNAVEIGAAGFFICGASESVEKWTVDSIRWCPYFEHKLKDGFAARSKMSDLLKPSNEKEFSRKRLSIVYGSEKKLYYIVIRVSAEPVTELTDLKVVKNFMEWLNTPLEGQYVLPARQARQTKTGTDPLTKVLTGYETDEELFGED